MVLSQRVERRGLDERQWWAIVVAAVVCGGWIAVLGGCGAREHRRPSSLVFSHAAHARHGITCEACHEGTGGAEMAPLPVHATCLACHGPTERRRPYPYEELIHAREPASAWRAEPRYFDLRFSHEAHVEQGLECAACHAEITAGGDAPAQGVAAFDDCATCHVREGVPVECEVCHETLRPDVAPPDHDGPTWIRIHGDFAEHGTRRGHSESCELCHTRTDCVTCHSVQRPMDHTAFFRDTSCGVCHPATPSHDLATPIPPTPHPGPQSDCYRCHLRPPHADNGLPFTLCHR